jgi:hypothetical protein
MNGPCSSLTLALAGVLCLGIAPAAAQSLQPIFGKQYTRASGTPLTVSDTFSVCDPAGTFRMVVLNGSNGHEQIGEDSISSGSIFVNGTEVVAERDFNPKVTRIERSLTAIGPSNAIDVRIRSGPSAAIHVAVDAIQNCRGITITAPAPGTVLTSSSAVVHGQVRPSSAHFGVSVNETPAFVVAGQFTAIVPLESGSQAIVARLTDGGGDAEDAVTVQVAPVETSRRLSVTASPRAGVAPLAVELAGDFLGTVARYDWDVNGDGVIDASGDNLFRLPHQYSTPGVYFPALTVTSSEGTQTAQATAVAVFTRDEVVALLQDRWQAFRDALRRGDVPAALTFIAIAKRDKYEQVLQGLTVPLTDIDDVLFDLRFVQLRENTAEFEMLRDEPQGRASYLVRFVIDADGSWRIRDM